MKILKVLMGVGCIAYSSYGNALACKAICPKQELNCSSFNDRTYRRGVLESELCKQNISDGGFWQPILKCRCTTDEQLVDDGGACGSEGKNNCLPEDTYETITPRFLGTQAECNKWLSDTPNTDKNKLCNSQCSITKWKSRDSARWSKCVMIPL